MSSILAVSALALAGSAYAAPAIITGTNLPGSAIWTAGGGPLPPPSGLSQNALGDFQVANFLENLVSTESSSLDGFDTHVYV